MFHGNTPGYPSVQFAYLCVKASTSGAGTEFSCNPMPLGEHPPQSKLYQPGARDFVLHAIRQPRPAAKDSALATIDTTPVRPARRCVEEAAIELKGRRPRAPL